jgi:rRNA maturation protein Nop10
MMPKLPYLKIEEVEALASIEQIIQMLNLNMKGRYTLKCDCPVHGGENSLTVTPSKVTRRGSVGAYKCFNCGEPGGDRVGLVAHVMGISQQQAMHEIWEHFGGEPVATVPDRVTVPNSKTVNSETVPGSITKRDDPPAFDPEKFAAKHQYDGEIEGLSAEIAKQHRIGFQRGKLFIPICPPDVTPVAYAQVEGGKVRLRDEWLKPSNVVKLPRRA